ncbi:Plasma membrane permease, mediates uptake of glycerophosphoinositol and glycerophosphocholine [Geranomyces variabilis]|uniref:Plasma membrane permease, mediates uptake of glycerophosphoinositol and glycerophosphocholine n=1 Tax=Geranomyces variabilis TaxID=109894 RepID=A0AAD5XLB8_9FUNG|nr:Plasma membrane permease, mediates uptake of glycerophosphoinositol and glycerophosphocholine [Geranomyces variabilis]
MARASVREMSLSQPDTLADAGPVRSAEPAASSTSVMPDDPAAAEAQKTQTGKSRAAALATIIFAGIALTSDGYQNNVFNFASTLFTRIYPAAFTPSISTRIGNALIVGAIIGQLGFGLVIDRFGRKIGLLVTTLLIVLGTLLCAVVYPADNSPTTLFWAITICRGITGVGVGGEYPCSSASASEASDETKPTRRGGVFVLVTNLVLSMGGVLATIVYLILFASAAEGEKTEDLNKIWRIAFGLGGVLPLSVFWFRFKMANSDRFKKNYSKTSPPYRLAFKRLWPRLVGTAGCWFLYDFVVFPNGIFSSAIIAGLVTKGPTQLRQTAEWQLLLGLCSLPGILLGAHLVDRIGRKKVMTIGFVLSGIMGFILAGSYDHLQQNTALFVVCYGLFISASNFGPGNCLGLISAEVYPTPLRGTFYGLSAAIGKAGAAIGNQILIPLRTHYGTDPASVQQGTQAVFYICASVAFLGAMLCWTMVPDFSGQTLEKEDREWREYLIEHGVEAEFGFDDANVGDMGTVDDKRVGLDSAPTREAT